MAENITVEDIKRAVDAAKPVPKEIGLHVKLSTPEMNFDLGGLTTTQKWAAMLLDAAGKELDKSLGEEILAKARAEGITDLYVLDAGFCLDAVKEVVARRLAGEMPCFCYCNILEGKNCQLCTHAQEWFVRYHKALSVLGLALKLRDRGHVIAGLGVRPFRAGHSFLCHVGRLQYQFEVVCPEQ